MKPSLFTLVFLCTLFGLILLYHSDWKIPMDGEKIEGVPFGTAYFEVLIGDSRMKVSVEVGKPFAKEQGWLCEVLHVPGFTATPCSMEMPGVKTDKLDWDQPKIQEFLEKNPEGKYICQGRYTKVDVTNLYKYYSHFSENLKGCNQGPNSETVKIETSSYKGKEDSEDTNKDEKN